MKRSEWDIKFEQGQASERSFARLLKDEHVFECKSDKELIDTGNIFLEFMQNPNGAGRRPSGIHPKSTKSVYWATEFAPNQWLVVPTEYMRRLGRVVFRERVKAGKQGYIIGGDNRNEGVLIPFLRVFPFLRLPWVCTHERWMRQWAAQESAKVEEPSIEEMEFFGRPLPQDIPWMQPPLFEDDCPSVAIPTLAEKEMFG